jgi:outer membrane protein assembly factor BamB
MRMPLAFSGTVALLRYGLSAANVLTAFVLVLGGAAAADQPAKAGNQGPALRWRVATSQRGDYVLALAVGKDGLIYSGTWIGTNVDVFAPDGTLRRQLSVGNGTKALAVGRDGSIFAGTDKYTVAVFGPDGTRRSSLALRKSSMPGGAIEALVAADNGVVYAAAGNELYAIDPDGAIRWQSTMLAPIDALTLGSNGIVYAGAGDTIYAFGPDGILKSKFGVGVRPGIIAGIGVVALAVGRSDMLYAGTRDRIVYALDATDGAVKWTFKPRGTPFSVAEGHDGAIYVGSYDGNIYTLDPAVGRVRWRFATGNGRWGDNSVHALAVGSDGVLYAGVGNAVEAITLVSSQK